MLKYTITFIYLVFIGFTANSQILISILFGDKLNSPNLEFGLDGGLNMSRISGLESKSYAVDLHLGFYFDFRIKEELWFNTGVLVKSSQGANNLTKNDVLSLYPNLKTYLDSGQYSQSLGSFNVPLMLKYRFKNHFFIELGPQVSLLTRARLNYVHSFNDVKLTTSANNRDSFNRFDVGLVSGIGYKLRKGKGMNIGVKYYVGLTDITKSNAGVNKNNVIYFKVDIPIGREKEAENN